MNNIKGSLPSLIVTLAVLTMFTILTLAGKITTDNLFMTYSVGTVLAFWFSAAAHQLGSALVNFQSQQPSQAQQPPTDIQSDQSKQITTASPDK